MALRRQNEARPEAKAGWTIPIAIVAFAAVALAETWRPLRRRVESRSRHTARDVAVGAISAATTSLLQRAFAGLMPSRPAARRGYVRVVRDVLLLDYSLWVWHLLNHRVPFLWRFHRVHHVDRDLDAATGLRFHFGEMALSVIFRMAQLRVIRPDPWALTIWQTLLLPSIFFHHSNIRLDPKTDRRLGWFIVTPRMHGIHHSDAFENADSNWASLLTIWDVLHGTLRLDIPQEEINIGVPAYEGPEQVTLPRILVLPMHSTRHDWQNNGE